MSNTMLALQFREGQEVDSYREGADGSDRRVWLDVPIRQMDSHHCGAQVPDELPHPRRRQ